MEDGNWAGGMAKDYVIAVEGIYQVGETRVSLDSLVDLYREVLSVESMVDGFPVLTLEQVHGALAFYLANRGKIDSYLLEGRRLVDSHHQASRQTNAELIARLRRARDEAQIPS